MSTDRRSLILIAEDNSMISMMIEDELTDAGFDLAGPFTTCATALNWLGGNTADAAVLDLTLSDGPCTDLARVLGERGIPFVVHSGRNETEGTPEFRDAKWITKPATVGTIVEAVSMLVGRQDAR